MCFKDRGKKIFFFIISNIIGVFFVMNFFNNRLMPIIYDYGKYKCNSFMVAIINYSVNTQFRDVLIDKIVVNENGAVDINVEMLNSITCNSIMKSHQILNKLENGEIEENLFSVLDGYGDKDKIKKGIIYEVPLGKAFNNTFVSNLGISIPVRYKVIGDIRGEIVSNVKEYGINNALIEIGIKMTYKSKIAIPLITEEIEETITIPLIIKLVQGEIPDYLIGTNFNGRV